ncbi:DUF6768 family protein [Spongiivirga citrea]|uniref:Uncharacterized protein n=1 Tax=Spongiivirga citrea TaxID=1481457 RepID=A0A6M0CEY1_9FLAO|nr:DUF6768 family protein [Spongiivirga citrea]NER16321.1 hypothetical protein [Spongiivirga citrea]
MKNDKEEIDKLIKQALTEEEAQFYDELDEQNLIQKFGNVHKGKTGWLATIMTVFNIAVAVLLVYCIVQFLNTEQTNELIKWAAAGFLCMIFMSMIKLYVWLQMDKNDILRELKRLELQVASFSSKQNK